MIVGNEISDFCFSFDSTVSSSYVDEISIKLYIREDIENGGGGERL